jgi:asparagine synthase (glutamine-hydrolysing)
MMRKRKQGFSVPLRDWMRGSLDEMVGDYLSPQAGRLPTEIFNSAMVERLLQQHRQGAADHSSKLWLLLNYAAWHEQYVPQPAYHGIA